MSPGVIAAFGAAALYNLAVVIQKRQAQREKSGGVRLVMALFARPLWLLGLACQVVGLGLHAFALTRAPVTVVQPIIAAGIVFLVAFAVPVLGELPAPRELLGTGTTIAGVALLIAAVGGPTTMSRVSVAGFAASVAAVAVIIAGLLGAATRPGALRGPESAVLFGLAAGVAQGMSDAMNRLMGAWLSPGAGWTPPAAMGLAGAGGLLAFGVVGFVTAQNAFKSYRANTVVPTMLTAELSVPVVVAVVLYGQELPPTRLLLLAWAAAVALIVVGVAILAGSSRVAATFSETA